MAGTTFYAYGFLGYEEEMDSYIKTRVIFAVADAKKERLAWYEFSQDVLYGRQGLFDAASIERKKLDRNEVFGSALYGEPSPSHDAATFSIGQLAPRVGTKQGAWANLTLFDQFNLTNCLIYTDDIKPNGLMFGFDLIKEGDRRTFDLPKDGRLYLWGVEKFSKPALARGPTPALSKLDIYDPIW